MKYHNEKNNTPIQILIVDVDDALVNCLKERLKNCNVIRLASTKEAHLFVQNFIPDIIVSELHGENIDGIKLCSNIKRTFNTSHIPIVLIASESLVEQKIQGLIAGADALVEKPFDARYILALVNNLLAQRRNLQNKFSNDREPINIATISNKPEKSFIEKVDEIIHKNISDPEFSLEHIIDAMHTSRSQLYRKFKYHVNKNPGEYIRIIRLKYAMKLLGLQRYSVCEIADMSGFGNSSNFITCFKKHYGKSPRKYINSKSTELFKNRQAKAFAYSSTNEFILNSSQQNFYMFPSKIVSDFDHNNLNHYNSH